MGDMEKRITDTDKLGVILGGISDGELLLWRRSVMEKIIEGKRRQED